MGKNKQGSHRETIQIKWGEYQYFENTHWVKIRASVLLAGVYFCDTAAVFECILKNIVVSQLKPVTTGYTLTSIRTVNIIVVNFMC